MGEQISIGAGAQILEQRIYPEVLKRFGVSHVHLVAHSKGGFFARKLLKRAARGQNLIAEGGTPYRLGVYSLTTLETPHHGNQMADAALELRPFGPLPLVGGMTDLGRIPGRPIQPADWSAA